MYGSSPFAKNQRRGRARDRYTEVESERPTAIQRRQESESQIKADEFIARKLEKGQQTAADRAEDMRVGAEACCCGSSIMSNILGAANAISQLRLQTIYDNVKPLQQALGSRQSRPFIVGGLATGVLLYYCGHRWLKQKGAGEQGKLEHSEEWQVEPAGAEQLLKTVETGAGDGAATEVENGRNGGKGIAKANVKAEADAGDDAETVSNAEQTTSMSSNSMEVE